MLPLSCSLQCSHTGLLTVNQTHQVYSNLRIFARSVTSAFPMAASLLLKSKFKPHFFKEDFLEYTVYIIIPSSQLPSSLFFYFPQNTQHYRKSYLYGCLCVFLFTPLEYQIYESRNLDYHNYYGLAYSWCSISAYWMNELSRQSINGQMLPWCYCYYYCCFCICVCCIFHIVTLRQIKLGQYHFFSFHFSLYNDIFHFLKNYTCPKFSVI